MTRPRLIWLRVRLRGRLHVSAGARVGRGVRIAVGAGGRVTLGAGCVVGASTRIDAAPGGRVAIGAGAVLGERCVITAREHVSIGERVRLADEVVLIDFDHGTADVDVPVRLQGLPASPIAIGAGAALGPGAAVLRGVTVGAGATVGARSVVVRDVDAGATVAGVPAHAPKGPRRQVQAPAPRA